MANLFDVKGKVVLVTGGAKGIGYMIATGFVKAGAKVYIASRDAASLDKAAKDLTALGPGSCHALKADLQKVDDIEKLVAELSRKETKLNVLVNNSGANWGADYDKYPDEAFTKVLVLNLQRVFTLTQKLTPLLEAGAVSESGSKKAPFSDPARIINIGSIDGVRVPSLSTYAYSSSKAGLHHLSRALASHLGARGITSNTLACGPFQSKMMQATLDKAGDSIKQGLPLGRIGTPEDVAGACIFLSSRAGAFVTGATIALDGGSLVAAKL